MRSLAFKLAGAFAIVIFVTNLIIVIATARATLLQVGRFATRESKIRLNDAAEFFAGYYAEKGSWEEFNPRDWPLRQRFPPGASRSPFPALGRRGERLLLTDPNGRLIFDFSGPTGPNQPPASTEPVEPPFGEISNRVPVTVDGQVVGQVVLIGQSRDRMGLLFEFLNSLNRAVLLAVVAAGFIAVLLGGVLVRQMTAPLRRLNAAAQAIAAGDLDQRVEPASADEIGALTESFNHMAGSLQQVEQARRHMIADIAHELRTPLAVIQGQLEALLDGVFPFELEQLGPIHNETLLLSRLVADLGDLARAEAGQLQVECQPLALLDVACQVLAAVEPVAVESGVYLSLAHSGNLPVIAADADRLRQVFHNLLGNALRHTPSGGTIQVDLKLRDSETVLVQVTDSGPGISPHDLDRVFDRFYRADKSRSRAGGGSGLGLTISRHIVEAHGGQIWAESPVNASKGTRLAFTLPVTDRKAGPG
ncbi:MAG: sensor histidine kinase [Anaerolineae bacterium]